MWVAGPARVFLGSVPNFTLIKNKCVRTPKGVPYWCYTKKCILLYHTGRCVKAARPLMKGDHLIGSTIMKCKVKFVRGCHFGILAFIYAGENRTSVCLSALGCTWDLHLNPLWVLISTSSWAPVTNGCDAAHDTWRKESKQGFLFLKRTAPSWLSASMFIDGTVNPVLVRQVSSGTCYPWCKQIWHFFIHPLLTHTSQKPKYKGRGQMGLRFAISLCFYFFKFVYLSQLRSKSFFALKDNILGFRVISSKYVKVNTMSWPCMWWEKSCGQLTKRQALSFSEQLQTLPSAQQTHLCLCRSPLNVPVSKTCQRPRPKVVKTTQNPHNVRSQSVWSHDWLIRSQVEHIFWLLQIFKTLRMIWKVFANLPISHRNLQICGLPLLPGLLEKSKSKVCTHYCRAYKQCHQQTTLFTSNLWSWKVCVSVACLPVHPHLSWWEMVLDC